MYGPHICNSKCIIDAEQQSVYNAVLTLMSEHSQLVGQWLTYTTSLSEVTKELRLLQDKYNGEDAEVSQSANCLRTQSTMDAIQITRVQPYRGLRYAIPGGAESAALS